eukprot:4126413-Amphidinium_carterae.1
MRGREGRTTLCVGDKGKYVSLWRFRLVAARFHIKACKVCETSTEDSQETVASHVTVRWSQRCKCMFVGLSSLWRLPGENLVLLLGDPCISIGRKPFAEEDNRNEGFQGGFVLKTTIAAMYTAGLNYSTL